MSGVIYKRFLRKCISAGLGQYVPVKRFSVAYNGTFTFSKKQLVPTVQGQRRYSNTTEKTKKTGKSSSLDSFLLRRRRCPMFYKRKIDVAAMSISLYVIASKKTYKFSMYRVPCPLSVIRIFYLFCGLCPSLSTFDS